jgi:hypothetical protein
VDALVGAVRALHCQDQKRRPFFWYFNHRGISVDQQYWGTSIGGYYLLLVCLLSFLQWGFVGFSIDCVRQWFSRKPIEPHHNYQQASEQKGPDD